MTLLAEPGSPTLAALPPSPHRAPIDDADWPELRIPGRRQYPPSRSTGGRCAVPTPARPPVTGCCRAWALAAPPTCSTQPGRPANRQRSRSSAVRTGRSSGPSRAGHRRGADVCRRQFRLAYAVDPYCTAPVLGYGVSAAGAYLVTAYLPGYRSGNTLLDTPAPVSRLWRLGSALATTLAAIRARGVIHCDVKPSNLLVRRDDVRLIDFGIARYTGQPSRADGIVQCSRGWTAPEQLTTAPVTPAVDVFAWGWLIAYLAGGVHPYASNSAQEWMLHPVSRTRPLRPTRRANRGRSPDLGPRPTDPAERSRPRGVLPHASVPTSTADVGATVAAHAGPPCPSRMGSRMTGRKTPSRRVPLDMSDRLGHGWLAAGD